MNDLLGRSATDTISGFSGIVTGRVEYISGCDQVLIWPAIGQNGEFREGHWFDVQRVAFGSTAVKLDNSKTPGPDVPAPMR